MAAQGTYRGFVLDNPHEVTHVGDFFRPGWISMGVYGGSGTGKSVFVRSLIPFLSPEYKNVILATRLINAHAHELLKRDFEATGRKFLQTNSPTELVLIVTEAQRRGRISPNKPALLIFDDFNAGKITGPYADALQLAFMQWRNNGMSNIVISQRPSWIPPIVRNNCNCNVAFNLRSKIATQHFFEDLVGEVPDTNVFADLVRYTKRVPHTYIMVRQGPFDVSAGNLGNYRVAMTDESVMVPTISEIRRQIGRDVEPAAAELQRRAGNTALELESDPEDDK